MRDYLSARARRVFPFWDFLLSLFRRMKSQQRHYARDEIIETDLPEGIVFREWATPDGPYFTTESRDDPLAHPMSGYPSGWKW